MFVNRVTDSFTNVYTIDLTTKEYHLLKNHAIQWNHCSVLEKCIVMEWSKITLILINYKICKIKNMRINLNNFLSWLLNCTFQWLNNVAIAPLKKVNVQQRFQK